MLFKETKYHRVRKDKIETNISENENVIDFRSKSHSEPTFILYDKFKGLFRYSCHRNNHTINKPVDFETQMSSKSFI